MDTNLLTALLTALAQKSPPHQSDNTVLLVVGMIISAMLPTLTAFAAYIKAQASDQKGEKAAAAALATTETVDAIHTAVNSERTAMLAKLEERDRIILELTKGKAVSEEHARAADVRAGEALTTVKIQEAVAVKKQPAA
jgi:hypothetical protein